MEPEELDKFEIDLHGWTTHSHAKELKEALDRHMVNQAKVRPERAVPPNKSNVTDMGIFRIQKVNNGYFIQVGIQDGYHTEAAYVCTDANEIGNLITAHIVAKALD